MTGVESKVRRPDSVTKFWGSRLIVCPVPHPQPASFVGGPVQVQNSHEIDPSLISKMNQLTYSTDQQACSDMANSTVVKKSNKRKHNQVGNQIHKKMKLEKDDKDKLFGDNESSTVDDGCETSVELEHGVCHSIFWGKKGARTPGINIFLSIAQ